MFLYKVLFNIIHAYTHIHIYTNLYIYIYIYMRLNCYVLFFFFQSVRRVRFSDRMTLAYTEIVACLDLAHLGHVVDDLSLSFEVAALDPGLDSPTNSLFFYLYIYIV